jgi:hypothetical protein
MPQKRHHGLIHGMTNVRVGTVPIKVAWDDLPGPVRGGLAGLALTDEQMSNMMNNALCEFVRLSVRMCAGRGCQPMVYCAIDCWHCRRLWCWGARFTPEQMIDVLEELGLRRYLGGQRQKGKGKVQVLR